MRSPQMDWLMTGEGEHCPRMHLELSERKGIVRHLTDMCEECASRHPGWDAKLTGQLIALLVDCMRMYASRTGAERDKAAYSGYVAQALRHIDTNYSGELSVSRIAEAAGVSADYLTRQFRMVTGITPLEYLKRYRFARAMELLQSGSSVTEASERVGFQNLCHFSREFRKSLGITPSQYRNQNHEGGNESWH